MLQKYELIPPENECASPDGHSVVELKSGWHGPIPVRALCQHCGDPYTVVVMPRSPLEIV